MFQELRDSGKWKWRQAPAGHDHFTCSGCGAEVYRPERPFDDDSTCLNCWPPAEGHRSTAQGARGDPAVMTPEEIETIARQMMVLFAQDGDAWMGADDLVTHLDEADAEAVYRHVQIITESRVRTRQ